MTNYNSLKARIKSRFMMDGGMFFNSIAVLSGSPGSAESFAEKLTTKREDDEKSIIYNTPQWEVLKDKIKYSGKTFKVFIGDESNSPKILDDPTEISVYKTMFVDHPEKVIDVPIEYRKEFEDDIQIAIQDIAGAVTRSSQLYITNVEKLKSAFNINSKFFNIDVIKLPFFTSTGIKDYMIDKEKSVKSRLINPDFSRFIHIDLGISNDLAGIAMTHIADHILVSHFDAIRKTTNKTYEPWYMNDFNIGISRNSNEETNITKIKEFILFLRDSGVSIKKVTADGYQSTQLIQDLKFAGLDAEVVSLSRDSTPYDIAKTAIYGDRCSLVKNEVTKAEFLRFKKVLKSNNKYKIVHPPTSEAGSHGDIAESVVGSIYSAYKSSAQLINPLAGFGTKSVVLLEDEEDEYSLMMN